MVRTVVVIIFVCPGPCFSRIGDVMVSVLAPSTVDGGYEIGISCFPAKHAALRRKIKDGLARNHDNVSPISNPPPTEQGASTLTSTTPKREKQGPGQTKIKTTTVRTIKAYRLSELNFFFLY
jgi:hypothetical protein